MTDSERLLRDLRRAAHRTGLTMSYLGWKAIGNGRVHVRLAAGGYLRHKTAERLRAFLAAEVERRAQ